MTALRWVLEAGKMKHSITSRSIGTEEVYALDREDR